MAIVEVKGDWIIQAPTAEEWREMFGYDVIAMTTLAVTNINATLLRAESGLDTWIEKHAA